VTRYASLRYARLYDRLRAYDGATQTALKIIDGLRDLRGAKVVELGAGTGALTVHLAKHASRVHAFDKSKFMIAVAREKVSLLCLSNCSVGLADHRCIPLPNASADIVVAAWTLASLVYESSEEAWTEELDNVIREMGRLVRAGGVLVALCPVDPGPRDYLARLETTHRFCHTIFESSWRFPTIVEARDVIQFFFSEGTWKEYRSRWPQDFVTLGGVWWR